MPFTDPATQRAYQKDWMARRRADYLADKCCVVCGSVEALEIDHIDCTKKVSHRIWSWSAERREFELARCQVLCHDHHVEKSRALDWKRRRHGTVAEYNHHGCRCPPCKAAKSAANAKRRRAPRQI